MKKIYTWRKCFVTFSILTMNAGQKRIGVSGMIMKMMNEVHYDG